VAGFVLDYADPAQKLQVQSSDLGPSQAVAWDPALRTFQASNTASTGVLRLLGTPASDSSPRLLFGLESAPAGSITFAQPTGFQSFVLNAPTTVGRAWIAADAGGSGPIQSLAGNGVFLDGSASAKPFQLNLVNVQRAEGDLKAGGGLPFAAIASTGIPSSVNLRLNGASQDTATIQGLPSGVARIEWPNAADTATQRYSALGVAGATIHAGAVTGHDASQVDMLGSPGSWTMTVTPQGRIDYAGSAGASAVQSSGLFGGAAWKLAALQGVPSEIHVMPAAGMLSGALTTTGSIGRLTLALAPSGQGSSGQLPRPTTFGDLFTVDATDASGQLYVDLPKLQSASWAIPDAGAETATSTLRFTIDMTTSTARSAVLQAVHPDHQTRIDAPYGLPAHLDVRLDCSQSQWTLSSSGGWLKVQHQDANAGSLTSTLTAAGTLLIAPKANRAIDWNGASSVWLAAQSRWDQGYAEVSLYNAPGRFVVDGNGLKSGAGSVSALGTGTVGRADALLVPDASETVDRFNAAGNYVAVDMLAKAPYAALHVEHFQAFQWVLPDAKSQSPMAMTLTRSQPQPWYTLVSLSGPREDVMAELTDASATVGLSVYQSTKAYNSTSTQEPVRVAYQCTGGTGGRIDLTHVDVDTGQLLSSYIEACQGTTDVEATGAEPSRITMTAQTNQGGIGFKTTDLGTYLELDAKQIPSRLEVLMERGDCDVTNPFKGHVSTLGSGNTGIITAKIGDQSRVAGISPTQQVMDVRCEGNQGHATVQLPTTRDSHWDTNGCEASYEVGANRQKTNVVVETPMGYLHSAVALQSSNQGYVDFTFTNEQGIQHGASDQLATLEEDITLPTCMQFLSPVDRVQLVGSSVAPDLVVNLNKAPTPGGEVVNTIRALSLSNAATTSLDLMVHVQQVTQEDQFRSQLDYGQFGYVNTHVLDGNAKQEASGLHQNRLAVLLQNGMDYQTTFTDLKSFRGDVNHECGKNDLVNVKYERIPGTSPKPFSAWVDLGQECDRQLLDVENFPQSFDYHIDWRNIFDNQILMQFNEPIGTMHWWRQTQTLGDTRIQIDGRGALSSFIGLDSIPAGTFSGGLKFGTAGLIKASSTGGPIGNIGIGFASDQQDWYLQVGLHNANLDLEWDLDGDSRYDELPRYVFINTPDGLQGSLRLRTGPVGVGIVGPSAGPLSFNDFQFRTGLKNYGFIEGPGFKVAGSVSFHSHPPSLELYGYGSWWRVPIPNKVIIAI
jgi:hypothetical protein